MHVLVCPVERAGAIGIVPGNHFQIKSHDSYRGISMRNENANAISQENGFAILIFLPDFSSIMCGSYEKWVRHDLCSWVYHWGIMWSFLVNDSWHCTGRRSPAVNLEH